MMPDPLFTIDGTIAWPCRSGERIAFGYLISQKFTGERADVEVLRDGKPLELDIQLSAPQPLVPLHLAGADPSFLVVSGVLSTSPHPVTLCFILVQTRPI